MDFKKRQDSASSHSSPESHASPLASSPIPARMVALSHALSFLPHQDLVNFGKASRTAHAFARNTQVEGSKLTLRDLNEEMRGFQRTGLHGASSLDAPSLHGGVRMGMPSNFAQGSKLGPGFYLTEGAGPSEQRAADNFASTRVGKVGGEKTIFPVLTRNLNVLTRTGHPDGASNWVDLNKKPPPAYMRPDHRGGDVVHSTMADITTPPARELKIAPHMFSPTVQEGVHPNHKSLLEKDGNQLQREIEAKRERFGLKVIPPRRADGSLGKNFLNITAELRESRKKTT